MKSEPGRVLNKTILINRKQIQDLIDMHLHAIGEIPPSHEISAMYLGMPEGSSEFTPLTPSSTPTISLTYTTIKPKEVFTFKYNGKDDT